MSDVLTLYSNISLEISITEYYMQENDHCFTVLYIWKNAL